MIQRVLRGEHFNEDPHPGNLGFQKNQLAHFDFGRVVSIDTLKIDQLFHFVPALISGNREKIYSSIVKLCESVGGTSWSELELKEDIGLFLKGRRTIDAN